MRRPGVLVWLLTVSFLSLTACGGREAAAPAGVFFPRLTESQDAWPAALSSGTLVEKDGCVLLMPGDSLLIWPHEARVERTGSGALRITIGQTLVGQTGDLVQLGGGLLGESKDNVSQAEAMIGEPIPDRCRADGGYWLTAPPS
jgi:hypothetical protein